jgi:hypothetical protein
MSFCAWHLIIGAILLSFPHRKGKKYKSSSINKQLKLEGIERKPISTLS